MRKFIWIFLLPMFLFGAIDTIPWQRVHLYEDDRGYDHEVWSYILRDTLIDTNEVGWVDTGWGFPYADTFTWQDDYETLFIETAIEVGKFNLFSLYITVSGDVLDSLQIEYHPANVLADFIDIPWDWRIDTTYNVYADSLIHRAVLCVPLFKWIKWRFIDFRGGLTPGDRLIRMYFHEKETG